MDLGISARDLYGSRGKAPALPDQAVPEPAEQEAIANTEQAAVSPSVGAKSGSIWIWLAVGVGLIMLMSMGGGGK